MKKIILFCLSACLLGMLLLGCPNTGDNSDSSDSTPAGNEWADCAAVPGTIEPLPDDVNLLRQARNQISPAENEIVFFYYREDGLYDNWALWFWSADEPDGKSNWSEIYSHGYSTVEVAGHTIGYMKFNSEGTDANNCIKLTEKGQQTISSKGTFKFIVRQKGGWDGQTKDLKWELMEGNYFGILAGNASAEKAAMNQNVYSVADDAKPQIMAAMMLTQNKLKIGLSQKYAIYPYETSNGFSIVDKNGNSIAIKDMYSSKIDGDPKFNDPKAKLRYQFNFAKQFTIILDDSIDLTEKYYVKNNDFMPENGMVINTGMAVKTEINELQYTGNDLGLTLNGNTASFKVFAPLASEANVLLYENWSDVSSDVDNIHGTQTTSETLKGQRIKMNQAGDFSTTGIWQATNIDVTDKKYYVYELNNIKTVYRVCDINALVAAPDSVAAQIIDIDDNECKPAGWETSYTNPFGNSGADTKAYTEAIIYEMHIRDWSRAFQPNSTGKFDDITEALGTYGDGVLGQHLQDLGITHVQILPMFDYAQKNGDPNYNWGYNPYQYNVPEGRYVNNHDDGGQEAVKQMRAMIKAFHDAGIAVNMDVVYNHTSGTGTDSLYDMTVPYYYYRLNNGGYSSGSGCGNETDSSAPMFRKYMIDSLKHWMRDYHINGFRFDLMGLHERETMATIYTALKEIDPNVMVYGEPWTGGDSPVKNSSSKAGAVGDAGYGAFDDEFRDAIKGAEFGGFQRGQVQGTFTYTKDGSTKQNDERICSGLQGLTTVRNDTGVKGLALHYAECHDNYTLFDKLIYSTLSSIPNELAPKFQEAYDAVIDDSTKLASIKSQDKLAAAYLLLSQGTPFINGGQEFMRTKKGDPDSYAADSKGGIKWTNEAGQYNIDDVNTIDLSFKGAEKYEDVYNVYKGLIALRKSTDAFTKGQNVSATTIKTGVTKYVTKGSNADDEFCIYFNATTAGVTITTTGYSKVIDVTSGSLEESETLPNTVPAVNFVILKK